MRGRRLEKVNSLVQETLAKALLELDIAKQAMVTITRVIVAPDLREAKVYVDIIGDSQQGEQVLAFLTERKNKLQAELATLELKFTPTLSFVRDTGAAHATRIEELLHNIDRNAST